MDFVEHGLYDKSKLVSGYDNLLNRNWCYSLRNANAIKRQIEIYNPSPSVHIIMTNPELLAAIELILDGIDRDELADNPGWWETSTGAEDGARMISEIRQLFKDHSHPSTPSQDSTTTGASRVGSGHNPSRERTTEA